MRHFWLKAEFASALPYRATDARRCLPNGFLIGKLEPRDCQTCAAASACCRVTGSCGHRKSMMGWLLVLSTCTNPEVGISMQACHHTTVPEHTYIESVPLGSNGTGARVHMVCGAGGKTLQPVVSPTVIRDSCNNIRIKTPTRVALRWRPPSCQLEGIAGVYSLLLVSMTSFPHMTRRENWPFARTRMSASGICGPRFSYPNFSLDFFVAVYFGGIRGPAGRSPFNGAPRASGECERIVLLITGPLIDRFLF